MKTSDKLLAIIVAVIFVFSVVFVVCEYDHDCCGEHCSVCAVLHVVNDMFMLATDLFVIVAVVVNYSIGKTYKVYNATKRSNNLVACKTKQTA